VCDATERLYVHRDIYDAFGQALVTFARTVKVGPGLEQGTQMGPIQNARQHERERALIDESRQNGLKFLCEGDAPSGPGYFVPGRLLDNPPDHARAVAEEAFGPVLPLLRYDSVDEVVARANASACGLGGAVWSRDEELAVSVA
jgi:acyl-CoA reductase-like NAD-dependent aldehyde dehydrogenase